jgi:hypothetical protein
MIMPDSRPTRYFLGDGIIFRSLGRFAAIIPEIYRGNGQWELYGNPASFFTSAEEVDEATALQAIAEADEARKESAVV